MWVNADGQTLQYSVNTSLGTIQSPASFMGAWKTIHGVYITESGILAAAHLAGAGNVRKFFRKGYEFKDGRWRYRILISYAYKAKRSYNSFNGRIFKKEDHEEDLHGMRKLSFHPVEEDPIQNDKNNEDSQLNSYLPSILWNNQQTQKWNHEGKYSKLRKPTSNHPTNLLKDD